MLSNMAQLEKPGPKIGITVTLDDDVLEALEAYALQIREKRNPIIQRVVIEFLTKNGAWPPGRPAKKESRPKG